MPGDESQAKFMSATHMGMTEKPSLGLPGAKPPGWPRASTASASIPRRSYTVVKSYFIVIPQESVRLLKIYM